MSAKAEKRRRVVLELSIVGTVDGEIEKGDLDELTAQLVNVVQSIVEGTVAGGTVEGRWELGE